MADAEGDSQTQRIPEPGKATEIHLSDAQMWQIRKLRPRDWGSSIMKAIAMPTTLGPSSSSPQGRELFPEHQLTCSFLKILAQQV